LKKVLLYICIYRLELIIRGRFGGDLMRRIVDQRLRRGAVYWIVFCEDSKLAAKRRKLTRILNDDREGSNLSEEAPASQKWAACKPLTQFSHIVLPIRGKPPNCTMVYLVFSVMRHM